MEQGTLQVQCTQCMDILYTMQSHVVTYIEFVCVWLCGAGRATTDGNAFLVLMEAAQAQQAQLQCAKLNSNQKQSYPGNTPYTKWHYSDLQNCSSVLSIWKEWIFIKI
jgi:hypothetical protein